MRNSNQIRQLPDTSTGLRVGVMKIDFANPFVDLCSEHVLPPTLSFAAKRLATANWRN